MYEQAIKLLLDEAEVSEAMQDRYQEKLESNGLSAAHESNRLHWQARRKEMLEAVEALKKDEKYWKGYSL